MEIKTIDDLTNVWNLHANGKEYGTVQNYDVWTDNGWTKIKHVMRHRIAKKMYRILTHTGCVDVTEDHALLDKNKIEIAPKDCKINDELLHHFPRFELNDDLNLNYDTRITEDEAYCMGLNFYGFFDKDKDNKIPDEILNAYCVIRKQFFEGLCYGRGQNSIHHKYFEICGKIGAHTLFFLCKSLGYDVSLNHNINKPEIYSLDVSVFIAFDDPNRIKQIINLGLTYQYVYDLETENHHFQAGIGQMIVHNTDGTHIKGLILNMIEHFWPSLIIHNKDYVQAMSTPILKVFKKTDKAKTNPIVFYNTMKYDEWAAKNDNSKYHVKYYKGLGTSKAEEAREQFKEFAKRVVSLVWDEQTDEKIQNSDEADDESSEDISKSKTHEAITLAFDKKRADDRKTWLYKYNKNIYLSYDTASVAISDFINKDLIHFSNADNIRSIPSLCDGLKPSQRKILYAAFKLGVNAPEIKVAQFAGYVAQHTEYHHGEVSLTETIIGMAQNYPGSNNINLLCPNGTFGYRRQNGKEHAAARYLFTELEKVTPKMFREEDTPILKQLIEDGHSIEPETFAPIVPVVLINGCKGIGTGFSTTIYPYNPIDIVNNLRRLINGESMGSINPWFRGFDGIIKKLTNTQYEVIGKYKVIDEQKVLVTEIPITESIDAYYKGIEALVMANKDDLTKKIESCRQRSGNNNVEIEIFFRGNELQKQLKSDTLEKFLKLRTTISLTNFYLFNEKGVMTKYDSIDDIMREFYKFRLRVYKERKEYMIALLKNELNIIKYKVKFIEDILEKIIVIDRKPKAEILERLEELKYPKLAANHTKVDEEEKSYNYLTGMQLFSLTSEKIEELKKELEKRRMEYDDYVNTTENQRWLKELIDFEGEYVRFLKRSEDTDLAKPESGKKKRVKKIKV